MWVSADSGSIERSSTIDLLSDVLCQQAESNQGAGIGSGATGYEVSSPAYMMIGLKGSLSDLIPRE